MSASCSLGLSPRPFVGLPFTAANWPARIVATDKETGKVVWEANMTIDQPELRITAAPLAVKDKIIVGASGGDSGVRDYVAALDGATGKLLWRKFTIPAPGEPGSETWKGNTNAWQTGGAAVWVTGTYDPATNQTFGVPATRCRCSTRSIVRATTSTPTA